MRKTRRKLVLIWGVLIAALSLGGLMLMMPFDRGAMDLSKVTSSDPALQSALVSALRALEELRKTNDTTQIDCTQYFSDFNRYQDTGRYISFFKSIGIPADADTINGKYTVWFELGYLKLTAMGFGGFFSHDRLVISFITAASASTDVMSFKATLVNDKV